MRNRVSPNALTRDCCHLAGITLGRDVERFVLEAQWLRLKAPRELSEPAASISQREQSRSERTIDSGRVSGERVSGFEVGIVGAICMAWGLVSTRTFFYPSIAVDRESSHIDKARMTSSHYALVGRPTNRAFAIGRRAAAAIFLWAWPTCSLSFVRVRGSEKATRPASHGRKCRSCWPRLTRLWSGERAQERGNVRLGRCCWYR